MSMCNSSYSGNCHFSLMGAETKAAVCGLVSNYVPCQRSFFSKAFCFPMAINTVPIKANATSNSKLARMGGPSPPLFSVVLDERWPPVICQGHETLSPSTWEGKALLSPSFCFQHSNPKQTWDVLLRSLGLLKVKLYKRPKICSPKLRGPSKFT